MSERKSKNGFKALEALSSTALLASLKLPACVLSDDDGLIFANAAFLKHFDVKTIESLDSKTLTAALSSPFVSRSPLAEGLTLCLLLPENPSELSDSAPQNHTSLPLSQVHSDFISTVSHEFRTPLTSIKGFADTLLQYDAQLPAEEKRRFVSIIKAQADRLIRLVENLLTTSKLGAGKQTFSFRAVPLQKLLERVVESVQAKNRSQKPGQGDLQRFEIVLRPQNLEVWADPDRLEQVLLNLIDNAAKYSPTDAKITLRGEFQAGHSERVQIAVEDHGPGIPKAVLPKIFTQFYRVENPLQQDVEGTGLGLYITQSLTHAMNGEIFAESEVGQGSTFTVVFPAATAERQALYQRRRSTENPDQFGSQGPSQHLSEEG